ncbi:hypothetical protein GLOIN_2v1626863 [Rhizophagus irregularis DAOM 181602=DAOM 197198]|uniref:Uncharacterized protein n=1 Tax=Rhizophagus irregularis (strain DAOM 181602 / DAOM 197198 / MUCL 43194) TaxID=747089 RepID=A0A2P4PVR1_RHIID|nr:hypothetical protein GLOIN_2v1626863 [Rhizophagus irregularis DAOM 181602=DAOM 197198]POG69461.1 hypothetical protein GLOIN_2v1626863 [Rhizophagus irregularis DAOM 181602=DAOM 197198]|eukprot:XP_025176327.1 hypothetical protein GLOIN_2v1626863 [Rhizophagus irregularis DAOM 181602=DAOM 197198]
MVIYKLILPMAFFLILLQVYLTLHNLFCTVQAVGIFFHILLYISIVEAYLINQIFYLHH